MSRLSSLKIKGFFISIFVVLIPNAIFFVVENLGVIAPVMATFWIFTIPSGILSSILTYVLFVEKDEPIISLSNDLKILIDDFEGFLKHPNSAMTPNPFDNELEFWESHIKLVNRIIVHWHSSLKERVMRSRLKKNIDIDELKNSVLELCGIVKYYLLFSENFKVTATKNSLSSGIRERYNKKFVNEFNTIFRIRLLDYLRNFSKVSGIEEIRKIEVDSAILLE